MLLKMEMLRRLARLWRNIWLFHVKYWKIYHDHIRMHKFMKSDLTSLQVAIITGAAQGIGKAIARRLAQDGFAVAIADINPKALAEVKGEIEALGAQILALTADLTQLEDIQKVIAHAAEWGQLAVLVNNAGRVRITPFLEITEQEW